MVDTNSPRLDAARHDTFCSVTMKLYWVSKRSRPDLETNLSVLCTRAHEANEYDWSKLKRALQFVCNTLHDRRIISAEDLHTLTTWIDVVYAIHVDARSHTGAAISIGRGTVYCSSGKQKLNVKSLTEGEVVGASDKLPQTIWSKYFIEKQGYKIKTNNFNQDNQSAMKIEKNGQMSCGQKLRHIHIRYFFIKDKLNQENISVEYCPTENMVADFFTKPLQGSLFTRFRDVIMGYKPMSSLPSKVSKEHIEINSETVENQKARTHVPQKTVSWSDKVRYGTDKKMIAKNKSLTPLSTMKK